MYMGNQLIVIESIVVCLQEGNPLLLLCEAAGSMGTCIEIEDGHEVFVSFCMQWYSFIPTVLVT